MLCKRVLNIRILEILTKPKELNKNAKGDWKTTNMIHIELIQIGIVKKKSQNHKNGLNPNTPLT